MRNTIILLFCIIAISLSAYQADVAFTDSWDKQGLSIKEQNFKNLKLNYSINKFRFEEVMIDNENLTNIHLPGVFLPNDEGMPNLPGSGSYIAIPQGAKANLNIINYRIEKYSNIEIAPAPRIPLDTEDGPLEYNKNNEIYTRNANYPENFIQLSEPTKLRGVDVVMLGITPFQYNPVTKELLVYRDVEMEITYSGGTGHFGEDRLRSRWWDPIIKDAILNSSILPEIDYNSRDITRDGAEYLIICPDDATFITWANTIKDFRQQQGISTMIQTVTQVGGNTTSAIETYVNNAYNSWGTPPIAVLLLGDYGSSGNTVMSSANFAHPYSGTYISDNVFADVDGDDLPEIAFARMTAQNSTHLENMITKFIDYENQPPIDADFYDKPITALGWQDDRWFQVCSEVVGGFWNNTLGKQTVRINALGSPANNYNSGPWSTATNTTTVMNYFGPNGLGYLPATPQELGGFTGGDATDVNNAINSGTFMLQHRDHGYELGWGEPSYTSSNLSGIGNNDPVFVMSINCLTGRFDYGSEVFTEAFHRMEYGALGLIAASQVSYSFVNDVYVWGLYDYMWPDFDPGYGAAGNVNILPCFGNASAKYYLQASSWPSNPSEKQITYRLFHHHGDAFSTVYSEIPQNLTVTHAATILSGVTSFSVTANNGSFIALTVNNEIIGTADGTGSPVDITIPAQSSGTILVTITKQNYFRYSSTVDVIPLVPNITVNPTTLSETLGLNQTEQQTLTITNDGESGSTLNYSLVIENNTRSTSSNLKYKAYEIKEKIARALTITYEERNILKEFENKKNILIPAIGRASATCYPTSSDYWSGSTTSSTKTDNSEARAYGGGESGWIMFDVSPIPDDAAINSIVFNFYVNDTNYPYWSTTPVSNDPVTTSASTLYADVIAEEDTDYYNYQNEASSYATGLKSLVLGGGANTDLFNKLSNDWFAIGLSSRDSDPTYYLEVDGWNQTNVPCIVVNYTPNLPVLEITSPNGSEVWANGTSHNITWDHSGTALANVKLELSTNNGSTYSDIIASTPNDGTYEWTIAGSISEQCLVRVSDPSESTTNDVSDAVFRIYDTVSWLTIGQDNGSLGQSFSDNLTLTFDSSGLSAGTYNANIVISSNDPDEATVTIPVTLVVNDNSSSGSGDNSGNTSGPAVVDMPLTNIDGNSVDPNVSIDPADTLPITVNVTVTDEVQGSVPVAYPDNVIISYAVDIIGTISDVNLAFDLEFTGLTGLDQVHWLNGYNWEVPNNVNIETPNHITFNLTLTDRNASTEIILTRDDPLPVTLSSFTAAYISNSPKINWVTQSESDNIGWNVYRSYSGNFGQASKINSEMIPGNGTTSEPSFYSFTDEDEVCAGFTYWYWLESISGSGETESFGPVSLTIPGGGNNIPAIPLTTELSQNYPNPFNPSTLISFDIKENETGILTIYNIKGQLLVTEEFETGRHHYVWNAQDHASGVYLYKLKTKYYSRIMKMLLVK
ncbi:MAG: C25 family cysteine peptidase [Candidatus Tenebribacter davisii]|nr:C25 family cysteine peptidase [Candidatus Tenebribacter davisii]